MCVFVAARHLIATSPADKNYQIQQEIKKLKDYIEEMFADQNDINGDTRIQPELINQTWAELQVQRKISNQPCKPIGFIKPEE